MHDDIKVGLACGLGVFYIGHSQWYLSGFITLALHLYYSCLQLLRLHYEQNCDMCEIAKVGSQKSGVRCEEIDIFLCGRIFSLNLI